MPLATDLLAVLVCPKCKGDLEYRESESRLICRKEQIAYPIRDGIPIMLVDEARPLREDTRLSTLDSGKPE